MPVPGLHGNFDHCEQYAESGQKSFGALPVLLVFFHASLEVCYAATISVAQYSVFVVPSFM